MNDFKLMVDKKIEEIQFKKANIGIILVGSSKEKYLLENMDLKNISDIDIFVIRETGCFEREVVEENKIEWDISYISITDLKIAVDKEIASIISVLAKGYIFHSNKTVEKIMRTIGDKFESGPNRASSYELKYSRFKITSKLDIVKSKKENLEISLLINDLLLEILSFYYRINGIWKPPIKKIVKKIEDKEVRYATIEILEEVDTEEKIKKISKLIDIVLNPLGGFKNIWSKGKYPFDFN